MLNFDHRRTEEVKVTRTVFRFREKMTTRLNQIPMTSQMTEKGVRTLWALQEIEELEVTQ